MKKENYDTIYAFEKNNWWYMAKKDLFNLILKSLNKKFELALDIGCGVGSNLEVLKKFAENVVGIDNSQRAISYCEKKDYSSLHKMDAVDMDFNDQTFDLILCSDVLEHIPDKKAVKEITRVLKQGGVFVLSVPAHNYLWGPTDIISNHIKRYEKKEVKALLNRDFEIIKLSHWNFAAFIPNLFLVKFLSIINRNKMEKNTLDFTPSFLNNLLYTLLFIENRFFINFNNIEGVSIVGVFKKKNGL